MMRPRRPSHSTRFRLMPQQFALVTSIASTLPPIQAHAFRLRVSRTLQISAPSSGFVSDALLASTIDHVMQEIA